MRLAAFHCVRSVRMKPASAARTSTGSLGSWVSPARSGMVLTHAMTAGGSKRCMSLGIGKHMKVVGGGQFQSAAVDWRRSSNANKPMQSRQTKHWLRWKVVPEGQKACIVDAQGDMEVVTGPARVRLVNSTFSILKSFTAGPTEYLTVTNLDGEEEAIPGPTRLWFDPRKHKSIKVDQAMEVNANESVVVYGPVPDASEASGERIERQVVSGPCLYVPHPKAWFHNFSWHGSDPDSEDRGNKIPGAVAFTKIRHVPDQVYVDVDSVRTVDDALLKLKVMLFFTLKDLTHCLDHTHDPIVDLSNALSADIITFASNRTFNDLKTDCPQLNDPNAYPQLHARAEAIGFDISKVVFRGYETNSALQSMTDDAIARRTENQLAREAEEQQQVLETYKLECEEARARRKWELDIAHTQHELAKKRLVEEAEVSITEARRQVERKVEDADAAAAAGALRKHQTEMERHFSKLAGLGVELTPLLVAQQRGHGHKTIEVNNFPAGSVGASPSAAMDATLQAAIGDADGV